MRFEAPKVFTATGRHVDAFLRACTMVQWKTKLVRLQYDVNDGEIRASVHLPVEDGAVTPAQLRRCFANLTEILDRFHPVLDQALTKGKVNFPK